MRNQKYVRETNKHMHLKYLKFLEKSNTLSHWKFTTNDQPRSLMLQSYIGRVVYNKGGVSSCGLAIHKFKNILRQKKKKKNIL